MSELAVRETTALASVQATKTRILATDTIIPRLRLAQGTSDFVKERKAQLGDMSRSSDAKKLGDPDHPVSFIPLSEPVSTWVLECKPQGANRFMWRGVVERNAANEHLPWTFTADEDGKEVPAGSPGALEWRRQKCLNLYALLPQDIEEYVKEQEKMDQGIMPDLTNALSPIVITFQSTNFKAGKEVNTYFTQVMQLKQKSLERKAPITPEPWKYALKLGCKLTQNDQGSWYTFIVDRSKPEPVPEKYLSDVTYWVNIVNSGAELKIDSTGDDGEVIGESGNF